jgi:hypothetical protein
VVSEVEDFEEVGFIADRPSWRNHSEAFNPSLEGPRSISNAVLLVNHPLQAVGSSFRRWISLDQSTKSPEKSPLAGEGSERNNQLRQGKDRSTGAEENRIRSISIDNVQQNVSAIHGVHAGKRRMQDKDDKRREDQPLATPAVSSGLTVGLELSSREEFQYEQCSR